jgi:hypothetical protein
MFAGALPGCRRGVEKPAPSTVPNEVSGAPPRRHPPLPEDAELGRKATEQWQEHEEEEERNRRLCFDQQRLAQHRALLAALERLRKAYDRAKTKTEVGAAQARAAREAPALRAQFDELDPWQNSSLLVADDASLLDLLTQPSADLPKFRAELGQRLQQLKHKLKDSQQCEHE